MVAQGYHRPKIGLIDIDIKWVNNVHYRHKDESSRSYHHRLVLITDHCAQVISSYVQLSRRAESKGRFLIWRPCHYLANSQWDLKNFSKRMSVDEYLYKTLAGPETNRYLWRIKTSGLAVSQCQPSSWSIRQSRRNHQWRRNLFDENEYEKAASGFFDLF